MGSSGAGRSRSMPQDSTNAEESRASPAMVWPILPNAPETTIRAGMLFTRTETDLAQGLLDLFPGGRVGVDQWRAQLANLEAQPADRIFHRNRIRFCKHGGDERQVAQLQRVSSLHIPIEKCVGY